MCRSWSTLFHVEGASCRSELGEHVKQSGLIRGSFQGMRLNRQSGLKAVLFYLHWEFMGFKKSRDTIQFTCLKGPWLVDGF